MGKRKKKINVTNNKSTSTQDVNNKNKNIASIKELLSMLSDENGNPRNDVVEFFEKLQSSIDQKQTHRSAIASNFKMIIKIFLWIIFMVLIVALIAVIVFAFSGQSLKVLWLLLPLLFFGFLIFIMLKSVEELTKSDAYNLGMFVMTIISIIISFFLSRK